MDEKIGMPSLPDKSIELGYTDPVWGTNIQKKKTRKHYGRILEWNKDKTYFDDTFRSEWNLEWFNELNRVCKGIILLVPEKFKYWWIRNTEPRGDITIHWKNGFACSSVANNSNKSTYIVFGDLGIILPIDLAKLLPKDIQSTYLVYGKMNKKVHRDILGPFVLEWGFLNKERFIHPTPKGVKICLKILKELKPESIIDPFAGSGSFLKSADILGIKWIGYEINPIYKQDIDKRFSQITLNNYLEVSE